MDLGDAIPELLRVICMEFFVNFDSSQAGYYAIKPNQTW